MKLAFLGLGVMGYPMAAHLHRAGHQVNVYNRSSGKRQQWQSEFADTAFAEPAGAVKDAEIIFTCVGADEDLMAVMNGPQGVLLNAAKGALLVDHTTCSADLARRLNQQALEAGLGFIDAPVSGGQAGAESGQLTIMMGGTETDIERVKPVIQSYSKRAERIGPVGHGQLCKMVNQVCIAGLIQGLAEGLHFAEQAGLDAEAVISVISQGAAQSWQMDNRYKTMLEGEFDHGFAVDWMRKDLSYVLAEASRNGSRLPVTALVDQFYGDVQAMGGQRWDTSSLLQRLKADAPSQASNSTEQRNG